MLVAKLAIEMTDLIVEVSS